MASRLKTVLRAGPGPSRYRTIGKC